MNLEIIIMNILEELYSPQLFYVPFPFTVLTLAVKIFGCCTLLYHYYRWVFFIFDFVFSFSGRNGVSDTFALSPVYRIRQ